MPENWFNVDDSLLKQLFDKWIRAFPQTMGRNSEIIQYLSPGAQGSSVCETARELYNLESFPVLPRQESIKGKLVKWSNALWRQATLVL